MPPRAEPENRWFWVRSVGRWKPRLKASFLHRTVRGFYERAGRSLSELLTTPPISWARRSQVVRTVGVAMAAGSGGISAM